MNIADKKEEIKLEIDRVEDEKLIWAIARLLHLDEPDVPDWHVDLLRESEEEYMKGTLKSNDWDEVKESL